MREVGPLANETKKDELSTDTRDDDRFRGLDNVNASARELAERLRDTTVTVGEFAELELAFVVGLAEDIRDRTVSPELLGEARKLPVLNGLRVTTHRVVDLGFDAVSVGVRVGSDAVDDLLAPRERRPSSARVSAS